MEENSYLEWGQVEQHPDYSGLTIPQKQEVYNNWHQQTGEQMIREGVGDDILTQHELNRRYFNAGVTNNGEIDEETFNFINNKFLFEVEDLEVGRSRLNQALKRERGDSTAFGKDGADMAELDGDVLQQATRYNNRFDTDIWADLKTAKIGGEIYVRPEKGLIDDKEAYIEAVMESDGSFLEKARAVRRFDGENRQRRFEILGEVHDVIQSSELDVSSGIDLDDEDFVKMVDGRLMVKDKTGFDVFLEDAIKSFKPFDAPDANSDKGLNLSVLTERLSDRGLGDDDIKDIFRDTIKLNNWGNNDTVRNLSDGRIVTNPALHWLSKDEFDAAIDTAEGTPEEKNRVKLTYNRLREIGINDFTEKLAQDSAIFREDYSKFLAKSFKERTRGGIISADRASVEFLEDWRKNNDGIVRKFIVNPTVSLVQGASEVDAAIGLSKIGDLTGVTDGRSELITRSNMEMDIARAATGGDSLVSDVARLVPALATDLTLSAATGGVAKVVGFGLNNVGRAGLRKSIVDGLEADVRASFGGQLTRAGLQKELAKPTYNKLVSELSDEFRDKILKTQVATSAVSGGAQAGSQEYMMSYIELKDQGFTEEEANSKALMRGLSTGVITTAVIGAFGATGAESVFSQAPNWTFSTARTALGNTTIREFIKGGVAKSAMRGMMKEFGVAATAEGAEEAVDSIANNVANAMLYDENLTMGRALSEAYESFVLGGILGGGAKGSQIAFGRDNFQMREMFMAKRKELIKDNEADAEYAEEVGLVEVAKELRNPSTETINKALKKDFDDAQASGEFQKEASQREVKITTADENLKAIEDETKITSVEEATQAALEQEQTPEQIADEVTEEIEAEEQIQDQVPSEEPGTDVVGDKEPAADVSEEPVGEAAEVGVEEQAELQAELQEELSGDPTSERIQSEDASGNIQPETLPSNEQPAENIQSAEQQSPAAQFADTFISQGQDVPSNGNDLRNQYSRFAKENNLPKYTTEIRDQIREASNANFPEQAVDPNLTEVKQRGITDSGTGNKKRVTKYPEYFDVDGESTGEGRFTNDLKITAEQVNAGLDVQVGDSNVRPGINVDKDGIVESVDLPGGRVTFGSLQQVRETEIQENTKNRELKSTSEVPFETQAYQDYAFSLPKAPNEDQILTENLPKLEVTSFDKPELNDRATRAAQNRYVELLRLEAIAEQIGDDINAADELVDVSKLGVKGAPKNLSALVDRAQNAQASVGFAKNDATRAVRNNIFGKKAPKERREEATEVSMNQEINDSGTELGDTVASTRDSRMQELIDEMINNGVEPEAISDILNDRELSPEHKNVFMALAKNPEFAQTVQGLMQLSDPEVEYETSQLKKNEERIKFLKLDPTSAETIKDALEVMKNDDPRFSKLAEVLLDQPEIQDIANRVKLSIVSLPDKSMAGGYNPPINEGDKGLLIINKASIGQYDVSVTLAHELVHYLTQEKLKDPAIAAEITAIREGLMEVMMAEGRLSDRDSRPFQDNDEFVSHALTDFEFQDRMRKTFENAAKPKSFWEKMISKIKEFFGNVTDGKQDFERFLDSFMTLIHQDKGVFANKAKDIYLPDTAKAITKFKLAADRIIRNDPALANTLGDTETLVDFITKQPEFDESDEKLSLIRSNKELQDALFDYLTERIKGATSFAQNRFSPDSQAFIRHLKSFQSYVKYGDGRMAKAKISIIQRAKSNFFDAIKFATGDSKVKRGAQPTFKNFEGKRAKANKAADKRGVKSITDKNRRKLSAAINDINSVDSFIKRKLQREKDPKKRTEIYKAIGDAIGQSNVALSENELSELDQSRKEADAAAIETYRSTLKDLTADYNNDIITFKERFEGKAKAKERLTDQLQENLEAMQNERKAKMRTLRNQARAAKAKAFSNVRSYDATLANKARRMRRDIDEMSDILTKYMGNSQADLIAVFQEGQNLHLVRTYAAFEDGDNWADMLQSGAPEANRILDNMRKEMRAQIIAEQAVRVRKRIREEVLQKGEKMPENLLQRSMAEAEYDFENDPHFKMDLEAKLNQMIANMRTGSSFSGAGQFDGILKRRKNLPESYAEFLGREENNLVSAMRTKFKLAKLVNQAEMAETVRDSGLNEGWLLPEDDRRNFLKDEEGKDVPLIPVSDVVKGIKGFERLSKFKIREDYAEMIQAAVSGNSIADDSGDLISSFYRYSSFLNMAVTVGSTGSNVRNALGGLPMLMLAGVPPIQYRKMKGALATLMANINNENNNLNSEEGRSKILQPFATHMAEYYISRVGENNPNKLDAINTMLSEMIEFGAASGQFDVSFMKEVAGFKEISELKQDNPDTAVSYIANRLATYFAQRASLYQGVDLIFKSIHWQAGIDRQLKRRGLTFETASDAQMREIKQAAADLTRAEMPTYEDNYKAFGRLSEFLSRVPLFGSFASFQLELGRNTFNIFADGVRDILMTKDKANEQGLDLNVVRKQGAWKIGAATGTLALTAAAPSIMSKALMTLFGSEDEEEFDMDMLRMVLPKYERNAAIIVHDVKSNGEVSYFNVGYLLPHDSFMAPFRSAKAELSQSGSLLDATTSFGQEVFRPIAGEKIGFSMLMTLRTGKVGGEFNLSKDGTGLTEDYANRLTYVLGQSVQTGDIRNSLNVIRSYNIPGVRAWIPQYREFDGKLFKADESALRFAGQNFKTVNVSNKIDKAMGRLNGQLSGIRNEASRVLKSKDDLPPEFVKDQLRDINTRYQYQLRLIQNFHKLHREVSPTKADATLRDSNMSKNVKDAVFSNTIIDVPVSERSMKDISPERQALYFEVMRED